MNKLKTALIFLFCTISAGLLFLWWYLIALSRNIECVSNYTIHNDTDKMSLLISRKLEHGKGTDTLIGRLYREGKVVGNIERTINYRYIEENSRYTMTTETVLKGVHDDISDKEMAGCLSSLYIKPGTQSVSVIKNIGITGWMVYTSPVPLYFCRKES